MAFTVRAATPDDAQQMARLHAAAWQSAYAEVMSAEFLAGMDVERGAAWWRETLAGAPADPEPWAHLVAEIDGRVVAMVTVGPARDADDDLPRAQLWMLNAHPDAFGTGAATELHRHALGAMRGRGVALAYLWVARDNPRARRFYEREGWTADGGEKSEHLGGAEVAELRYVTSLAVRPTSA